MAINQNVQVYDWDTPITKESDFVELAPGVYTFRVSNFERKEYAGDPSRGLPPCPIAQYTLTTQTPDGPASINHSLFLNSSNEGRIGFFFKALGMKNSGSYVPDWKGAVGKVVEAEVEKDRTNPKFMRVKRFVIHSGQQQSAPQNRQMRQESHDGYSGGYAQPDPRQYENAYQQTYANQANFEQSPIDERF